MTCVEHCIGVPVQPGFHEQPESAQVVDVARVAHAVGVPVQDVPKTQPAILPQAVASAAELQSFGVPEQLFVEKQPLAAPHCWAERSEQAVALPLQDRAAPPEPPEPATVAPPEPATVTPPVPALVPSLPPVVAPPEPAPVPSLPEVPAALSAPAWPAFSTPPSPSPALPDIPPLSSPAVLFAPDELCPALFLPAPPALPPEPSLVKASLEPQFTTSISTDGTRINQPILLIF